MLHSYFIPYPKGETEAQERLRYIEDLNNTLDEAAELILSLYGEYAEAVQALESIGSETRPDPHEFFSDEVADILASFAQAKKRLEYRKNEILRGE